MGIPYYFAFLVKNYPEIMGAFQSQRGPCELYIDANSIVYDAIHALNLDVSGAAGYTAHYDVIIEATINKLRDLISMVGRGATVFIAFDGVAPRAKMEQQRQRRARMGASGLVFITPGTPFMARLNKALVGGFASVPGVILSTSDEPGEGEHKIFAHIRSGGCGVGADMLTYVYGLDADLIILSLLHLRHRPHLYLLREKNQMVGSECGVSPDDANTLFMLHIRKFGQILSEREKINIDDYIFMSFFLGNDFMPHFPALNIRTVGIDNLMASYRRMGVVGFVSGDGDGDGACVIKWPVVRKFITILAQKEGEWFYCEHLTRDKMEMGIRKREENTATIEYPCGRPEGRIPQQDNFAILNRETEKYIAPQYPNWEERYYMALFIGEDDLVKKVCINWLEGLEWCMKYYICGPPQWDWMYHYNYPPLLRDIVPYIPAVTGETFFDSADVGRPCSAAEQLAYVMPQACAAAAPKCEWAYCRYMWESHLL